MKQLRRNQNGFTVVELMVSVVVMGVLSLALSQLIITIAITNDRANDISVANGLAEAEIERLRSVGYAGLAEGSTDFVSTLPTTLAAPRTAIINVSDVGVNVRRIDIDISYNDHGKSRSFSYSTYIGELGIGQ